jgi:hypothetical protein
LNILHHLPRTSAYAQAVATDEELAEHVVELPDTERKAQWMRSHRDYTPEVEMLSAIFDRVGELIRVTAAMRGARGKQPPPAPRPATAVDHVRQRLAQDRHRRLVERLTKPAG